MGFAELDAKKVCVEVEEVTMVDKIKENREVGERSCLTSWSVDGEG